nr:FAD-dependent oxidoreductase [uncultured Bdellovibrio sp.]
MAHAQQHTQSLWQEHTAFPALKSLDTSLKTDVCIVGAGIAGLLTAYRLMRKGLDVVILEKDLLGFNETAHSTAHLSNALDDGYVNIRKWHGREGARLAHNSHTAAIDLIEHLVKEEDIQCDFQRVPGYLFLGEGDDRRFLEMEMAAAHDAGFFDAHLVEEAEEQFFDAGACLKFPRQAQIDPLKFVRGVCENILARGAQIYPLTHAEKFQGGEDTYVETSSGHRISCKHIVVTTNVPINDWMKVHFKEAAYRTYVVALKVPRGMKAPCLFWDTELPYHYLRFHTNSKEDYDVLIVGGEDHRVGQGGTSDNRFSRLRDWAERRLQVEGEVVASWSGQIIEPMDGLAYIGRNPGDFDNVYIAAGDSGHGITHGAISSMILSDLITVGSHPWAGLYNPSRFNWKGVSRFIKENIQTGIQYRDWISKGDNKDLEELIPGQGCVISEGLSKIAVYRSEDGMFHRLSAKCPHMGGVVHWNEAEGTWDCPVHGSRFNKYGEVLNGPALNNMSPEDRASDDAVERKNKKEGSVGVK